MSRYKTGLFFGFAAYVLWGLFPLYWPLLKPASANEIVSHRAVWTLFFCAIALGATKQLKGTFALIRVPRIAFRLFLTSILISINWLVYIWAVNHDQVIEGALGYYINPLIVITFGIFFLKERLRRLQWVSVAIAAVGVGILVIGYGKVPWIALALATSWGTYGLVKKQLNLGALQGIAIETLISSPFYLGYLLWISHQGQGHFAYSPGLTVLLVSAGIVTAVPLLFFNGSTTRLPLTIIGMLQYITPTIQFSLGVWLRHEPMPASRWAGFVIIWIALAILTMDLVKSGSTSNNSLAQAD
jgi:chloramphenicol-sensitive protein RarD